MYRIKTDIRQYKCDSVEKVEKLIHNWVIRPNDLVYSNETQRWSPIGEHPLFVRLFEILADQEKAEPATQVTESPFEAAQTEDPDEVTRIKERPVFEDDSAPDDIPAAPHLEDEEPTNEQDEKSPEDETLIGRITSADEKPVGEVARPEPPPEVEPVVRPDEVTVMTAKTLDLIVTSDDEPGDDEKTNITESPLAPETPPTPYEELAQASEPNPEISIKAPRIGRHDLPEEFFATNEIHGPISRDSVPPVDDLKAMYDGTSVDDAWGNLADGDEEEDLRTTEQMESPLEHEAEESSPLEPPQVEDDEAEGNDEDDDWDDYEISPIPADVHGKHAPRIADVYNIPLPFPILPSEEDQAAGLKRATTSRAEKDRAFPYPVEKTFMKAEIRNYDLTPPKPKDRTLQLVGTIVVGIVVILIVAALM